MNGNDQRFSKGNNATEGGTPLDVLGNGRLPGVEFPGAVYRSVVLGFLGIIIAAWLAFGGGGEADANLAFVTVLTIVFFALPVILRMVGTGRTADRPATLAAFLQSRVETATGSLSGAEAWFQVLMIPLVLALAAVIIGAVYAIVT